MKNLIGIFAVLALVITTTVPTMSYAKPDNSAKAAPTQQAADEHDCHGHADKTDENKAAQNDKDGSDKCCDKGVCKCVGGTCHNGISKIFGNSGDELLAFTSNQSGFSSADEFGDSALLEGLKRPPRT